MESDFQAEVKALNGIDHPNCSWLHCWMRHGCMHRCSSGGAKFSVYRSKAFRVLHCELICNAS